MKTPELTLEKTYSVCPEQYDLVDGNGKCVAYFRLRHSYFSVECPDVGGTLVYEAHPDGDGCFMPHEREKYIEAAMDAVKKHYGWGIQMKTPEEIKKGMECCTADINDCDSCPFREYNWCEEKLKVDALELLGDLLKDREERDDLAEECQNLEQRLAQAERERDAAVKDMERHKDCCTCKHQYNHFECGRENGCAGCPNAECHCSIGDTTEECWQWRGVCEENSKEAEV